MDGIYGCCRSGNGIGSRRDCQGWRLPASRIRGGLSGSRSCPADRPPGGPDLRGKDPGGPVSQQPRILACRPAGSPRQKALRGPAGQRRSRRGAAPQLSRPDRPATERGPEGRRHLRRPARERGPPDGRAAFLGRRAPLRRTWASPTTPAARRPFEAARSLSRASSWCAASTWWPTRQPPPGFLNRNPRRKRSVKQANQTEERTWN